MSQFAVKTQEKIDELHRSNVRFQELKTLQEETIKAIQEICVKLSKASEENSKRLNKVSEKHYHCNRDGECLDQEINKMFSFCQNMNPQPQVHSLDDPYQEDIKAYVFFNMSQNPHLNTNMEIL
ncbi:hypothetical protein O181_054837 [Austropuccinia psidii MF-1]|uniref:Uncharacterized protein n=1 Tax=Austropuccinia psidii MF-1 TaxID=1389203 RepID=A0A9Q3E7N9_9BASI|nr:hypothetical protein [Austropuccinia psidii MF-1]